MSLRLPLPPTLTPTLTLVTAPAPHPDLTLAPAPCPCPCPAPPANLGTREARLGDVGLIVLDEVHYLGDPSRGSVWEEVIINCPKHIQLLCMSATVRNPDDLGAWISQVGGGGAERGQRGKRPR